MVIIVYYKCVTTGGLVEPLTTVAILETKEHLL